MASCRSYIPQQHHRQWLAQFDDTQVIQQAKAGNMLFMEELFKRARRLEFEGDLLMACQLYRQGYRYFQFE